MQGVPGITPGVYSLTALLQALSSRKMHIAMPTNTTKLSPDTIDSPAMRSAGRELLSLALMDARNHTLQLLTRHEDALAGQDDGLDPDDAAFPSTETQTPVPSASPLWLAGHAGWFAERWIGRNTQRALGATCPQQPTRLASIQPEADGWWNPLLDDQGGGAAPDTVDTRSFLLESLESTLELLEKSAEDDGALYFYRLALFHEDLCGEALVVQAQTRGVALAIDLPQAVQAAEPVRLPATRWTLGMPPGGFAFDIEQGALTLDVPDFEIDAQPVSWAQFVEFVADGGYDREDLWQPAGWAWLQQAAQTQGRRGPRHVERIGAASGAVMQNRFGKQVRMAARQTAMHLNWWEADAWCRWAGRRLPSEVEWEVAAHHGARQGFRWGDVHEWVANTLHPWDGYQSGPWAEYSGPFLGKARVLRGASFATRARMKHPRFRGFALPEWDEGFVGFRSCAL